MASELTLPKLPVFVAISQHDPKSPAVVHCLSGRTFKYGELLPDVCRVRDQIYDAAGRTDLTGERIAFLVENSYDYAVTFLAILAARAIAQPLSPPFPPAELQYILSHSQALLLLHSAKFASKAKEVLATSSDDSAKNADTKFNPLLKAVEVPKHQGLGENNASYEKVTISEDTNADGAGMMLYTSGTTARPKGVLLPESALTAQSLSLVEAWKYSPEDRLLHVLPLHHIHGLVNAVLAPLFAGSTIEFLFPFNADTVWRRFAMPFVDAPTNGASSGTAKPTGATAVNGAASEGDVPTVSTSDSEASAPTPKISSGATSGSEDDARYANLSRVPITFFTAVPTVYTRLLSTYEGLPSFIREKARTATNPQNMRLAISGSAALPTPIKRAWRELSQGSELLERYGMTEVGMALSCGLEPVDRVDASVGWPLPGVEARLVDTDTHEVIPESTLDHAGELQLRGPNIFREYWANAAATAKERVEDDAGKTWFKTGDIAMRRAAPPHAGTGASGAWAVGPMYSILGRQSADIIKSGGEKVSALEVERELLSLDAVREAAVLAVPSGRWGQKVGAVLVLDLSKTPNNQPWKPMDMRRALRDRLANYKIPQVLRVVDAIPRNAMGKVNKKQLVAQVFREDYSGDEM
ncbi:AMP-binding enzyme-domain-containing protein [Xylariomycetidae sp. FL0641]|nr:AMP-binding enzyme-domain-containing protein [Xylariomycetidae sp. FL0641]